MSYRHNRVKGGIFKAGRPLPKPVGKIIANEPAIVDYEDAGSLYVEDGSGQRYIVKYADGHTAEVEFSDQFDAEASTDEEEIEENPRIEEEEQNATQMYNVTVVWDGAVDFAESYDANNERDRLGVIKDLIARYGKIAEDFVGASAAEIDEQIKEKSEDMSEESFI